MDQLQIFRGDDCVINDKIRIRQPTILEITKYGEQKYFSIVKNLTSTPADHKASIWDTLHVYWDQVDEYDLFLSMFGLYCKMDMSIILPEIDFDSFRDVVDPVSKCHALVNKDGVKIDRAIYTILTDDLREIHQLKKNIETGYDTITKDCMIEDERYDMQSLAKTPYKSVILPFASYLAVKHGFSEVWDVPIGAFFCEMQSEHKSRNYDNIMHGIYSGCVDVKKINKKELSWI